MTINRKYLVIGLFLFTLVLSVPIISNGAIPPTNSFATINANNTNVNSDTYKDTINFRSDGSIIFDTYEPPKITSHTSYTNLQGYDYRKQITINHSLVSGEYSFIDFPILIQINSDPDLNSDNVQSMGQDIRFTSDDGITILDYDIVVFMNNSIDGSLASWVSVPTLSADTDTILYMYYSNPNVFDEQNPSEVWSNYKAVYHFMNSPNDSTGNGNDLTVIGATTFNENGYYLDGIDDNLENNINATWMDDYSVRIDFKFLGEPGTLFQRDTTNSNYHDETVSIQSDGTIQWIGDHTGTSYTLYSPTPLSIGYHTLTLDVTNNTIREWYLDGVNIGSFISTNIGSNDNPTKDVYGVDSDGDGFQIKRGWLRHDLKQVLIYDTQRFSDLIITEYNNYNDHNSFYYISSQEPNFITEEIMQSITYFLIDSPSAVSAIFDGTEFTSLLSPVGITTTIINGMTFALVASVNGLQIIDITIPELPTAVSAISHSAEFTALEFPSNITTMIIDDISYAIITGSNGVQIIDISNPYWPVAVSAIFNDAEFTALDTPYDITTVIIDDMTYALVTSSNDNGVQIIDITNPYSPVAVSAIFNGTEFTALERPVGITTTLIDDSTHAIVASQNEGVQIIDITNPYSPVAVSAIFNGTEFTALTNPYDVTTVIIDDMTYALVTSSNSIQIIGIDSPSQTDQYIWFNVSVPTDTRLGGVFAITCPPNEFVSGLYSNGTLICTPLP